MVKNQTRENLRKHILDLGIIEKGVDRIVEQVVQPKVLPIFHPAVENAIYNFLGIKNPKADNGPQANPAAVANGSPKKAFRPMPVSVPSREQEDATPPPGEEFGLEAITPSPDSRAASALHKDLADEVSDVSMEDIGPAQEGALERICSPISPQSSSIMGSEKLDESNSRPASRVASALSAISSGDDLPSASPLGPSPVTPGDDNTMPPGEENDRSDSESERSVHEEEDEDSEFSSPEFEKLEITRPASRTVTPNPTDEKLDEEELRNTADDHDNWRPKRDSNGPDRKPDEDPGQSSAGTSTGGHSVSHSSTSGHASSTTEPKSDTSNSKSMAPASELIDAPEAAEQVSAEAIAPVEPKSEPAEKSKGRSRSRERKSESHKSAKRDRSSHKDRHKDRHRQRSRDRDRDKKKDRRDSERHSKPSSSKSERERDSERHRSSRKDKDRDRDRDRSRDRHRDKDRHRDRHRSKSESERGKSLKERDRKSEKVRHPRSPPHPKAYLWKRPAEKPKALADWLARFPDQVFEEAYNGMEGLTDVTVSSVSSYEHSDADSFVYLSDVEVDCEVEQLVASTGGKVMYKEEEEVKELVEEPVSRVSETDQAVDWDYTPVSDDVGRSENVDQYASTKRIRKANTRYSDSYVGSEFRKVINMQHHQTPEQPQRVGRPSSGGRSQQILRDYQQNVMGEPSPEGHEEEGEYGPSEPKRLKTEQPLPSSPESVQSDPSLGQMNPPASPPVDVQSPNDDDAHKDASPVGRRRST